MSNRKSSDEIVKKVISGARWAVTLRLLAQIFSWLSTFIVVRFLTPEDYGLNAMLESPLLILMLLSTIGLDISLVQSKNVSKKQIEYIFGWLLSINFVLFLLFFFGGALLALYYSEPILEDLAKALAFLFLLTPFRIIPNALLDRELKFKLRAQLEITVTIIAAISTLIMAYFGAGVWALVFGVLINKFLLAILLMIAQPWIVKPKFHFSEIYPLLRTGGVVSLSQLLIYFCGLSTSLIVGPTLGATILGLYVVAIQFASIPLSKGMPIINQTMLPAFSKLQDNPKEAAYYLKRMIKVLSIYIVPLLVGLACVADLLVHTVFGEKWEASITPLTAFSLGMILRVNVMLLRTAVTSFGRADLRLYSSGLQLLLIVPLTIFGINYGITGVIIAWIVTEIIITTITLAFGCYVFDVKFLQLIRSHIPSVTCSSIMALIVITWKTQLSPFDLALTMVTAAIIGGLSYLILLRLLFHNDLKTATKLVFGNRLRFLTK